LPFATPATTVRVSCRGDQGTSVRSNRLATRPGHSLHFAATRCHGLQHHLSVPSQLRQRAWQRVGAGPDSACGCCVQCPGSRDDVHLTDLGRRIGPLWTKTHGAACDVWRGSPDFPHGVRPQRRGIDLPSHSSGCGHWRDLREQRFDCLRDTSGTFRFRAWRTSNRSHQWCCVRPRRRRIAC